MVRECSKSHAYVVEKFRRMAQINPQLPRDYPKQFIIYLIFSNKKSRYRYSGRCPKMYVNKRTGGLFLGGSEGSKIPDMHDFCYILL